MRRARGCGGRFLNTKKLDSNNSIATLEKGKNTGANPPAISGSSPASECSVNNNEKFDPSNYQHGISVSMIWNMQNADLFGAPNGD